ncbi:MAG: lamin tail domain-containing protein [Saprospiraceae bacterium]
MRHLLFATLAVLALAALPLRAQIVDDFSDGNFTANPAWQGDVTHFIVNASGELQLNAPAAGSSALAVAGTVSDSAVWLLDVRLAFAPSATNLLRVYLMADQADLLQANGYYLEIGENGATDALRLFRQDGPASRTLLAAGLTGFVAVDPVDIRLRVRRSTGANWTVEARAGGSGPFEPQGTATDATHNAGAGRFFGVYCLYTATRTDKFFFDNLSVLPDVPDTTPPVLLSASANGTGTEVLALFDEDLDTASALEPAHYAIAGLGGPTSVAFAGGGKQQVRLTLAAALGTGTYTLQSQQIADAAGNSSGQQSTVFEFVKIEAAAEFDILVNEIMADPTPSVGLPEAEWLELHNRSGKIINLNTLLLSDGSTPRVLPDYLLRPDSFVVLATAANAAALAPFTAALGVAGFPALNNSGDTLVLTDAVGAVVDRVVYAANWHDNSVKSEGGWSLERINPDLPCQERENWRSCPVLPGGTPGKANASLQKMPDLTAPRLLAAFPDDANALELTFSEGLDRIAATDPAGYRIDPPLAISSVELTAESRRVVRLVLQEPLESGIVYAVSATPGLRDCSGNAAAVTDTAWVGLPETPAPMDVVVNEVLFNPATFGSDFVEIHNRSAKVFDLQHFFLANFSGGSDVRAIGQKRLLLPGAYLVFSPAPADITQRFLRAKPENILLMAIPALPDDAGNATLVWSKGPDRVIVDSLTYFDDWHNSLLAANERTGVSLERVRPDGPTNDPANWTSAARRPDGNGTPTLPNSQQSGSIPPGGNDLFQLGPARLSPDGDGYEDYLDIRYTLPGAGYAATVTIFDSEGVPVKRLVRQQLIGTEGSLRWDGDMDDGTATRPGIYIFFAEIFDPGGDVRQERKVFALVRRF